MLSGSPILQANTEAALTTSTMNVVAMILGNMLPRTLYVNERFASGDHNRAAAAPCSECHLTHSTSPSEALYRGARIPFICICV